MAALMKCKACGYVTDQKNIRDVCPACGVPAKMFEPYTHPVSEKRRMILELHIHPVLVHFPQAFAVTLLLLSLTGFFAVAGIREVLSSTIKVLSFMLPFFTFIAIAAGFLDGKIRFRKVTTPLLKIKVMLSVVFFVASVAMCAVALSGEIFISPTHYIFVLLAIIVSVCGGLLGLIGGRLTDAKFPG